MSYVFVWALLFMALSPMIDDVFDVVGIPYGPAFILPLRLAIVVGSLGYLLGWWA